MTEALEAHLRRQVEHSRRFFWHRLRWNVVRGYLPHDEPFELVDVGAGAGLLGVYLEQEYPQATYRFVEPIDSLRDALIAKHGPRADAGEDTVFDSTRFVTLLDVLEHQPDDKLFMAELVQRMPNGATLLVSVPARQSLWSQWDVALGHFRRYDKEALRTSIEGLPLDVQETSYLFPELVPLAWLRRRRRNESSADGGAATDFPDLPRVLNGSLYFAGKGSLAFRRHWRTGSSLFMVATVNR